jgi:WD40 repeat protein
MKLTWHPNNPTQLALACDDDKFSYINIWDLRKSVAPVSVLSGFHGTGILDLAWSIHDYDLLLASSKDGKILCWNLKLGEPISEVVGSPCGEIQWSTELKTLFVSSTTNGIVQLYSQHDALNKNLFKGKKANEITAPNWLQRNVGNSFGFGRKLLKFIQDDAGKTVVSLTEISSDSTLSNIARDFDSLVSQGAFDKLCLAKVEERKESKTDSLEWRFLHALVENNKEVLLNALGYNPQS